MQPAASLFGSISAVSCIHVNPEVDEVLVSQMTDTPHLYLFWKLWGLGTSNIVSIGNKREGEKFGRAELGSGVFPKSSHSVCYHQCALGWICWILNAINCFIRKNDGIQLKLWMSAHSVAILFGSCVSSCRKPMPSVYYFYYIDWRVPQITTVIYFFALFPLWTGRISDNAAGFANACSYFAMKMTFLSSHMALLGRQCS